MQATPDSATAQSGVCVYSDSANLLAISAKHVSQQHNAPDFSAQSIICENPGSARDFARYLALAHDLPAVLAPAVCNLQQWAGQFGSIRQTTPSTALELLELLRNRKQLLGEADPWRVSEELLTLFSELSLAGQSPRNSLTEFTAELAKAYGCQRIPTALSREAEWLYEFWRAWQASPDANQDYLQALEQAVQAVLNGQHSAPLLVGLSELKPAEIKLLSPLFTDRKSCLFIHRSAPLLRQLQQQLPSDVIHQLAGGSPTQPGQATSRQTQSTGLSSKEQLLMNLYEQTLGTNGKTHLRDRALDFASQAPINPLIGSSSEQQASNTKLSICRASDPEQEAHMLATQVRAWYANSDAAITIIAESRETGRRLRALLARVGIPMNDRGGWALSTTSAATALERWLQCIETDYAALPLLDLLKSPFIDARYFQQDAATQNADDHTEFSQAVWRFEQDIVRHEQVSRGLLAYEAALQRRRERLGWPQHSITLVQTLLENLVSAGLHLSRHLGAKLSPTAWLQALENSMLSLGLHNGLNQDEAGQQIIRLLAELQMQLGQNNISLAWSEFRTWLGLQLEQNEFRAEGVKSRVMLSNLAQAYLEPVAHVIIADATEATFNSSSKHSFFNDGVRASLGLSTKQSQRELQRHRLRRLICASEHCLFVWPEQVDGNPQTLLHELQLLALYQQIGWQHDIHNESLRQWTIQLAEQPQTTTAMQQNIMEQNITAPQPSIGLASLPSPLSASAHQNLIDCPYKFLYANILKLQAPEALRELLEKSDFGQLVHDCLHRYMAMQPAASSRNDATQRLEDIGRDVFAEAVSQNIWHAGWLQRYEALIPGFLDWQAKHQISWRYHAGERAEEQYTPGGYALRGRLDRLDENRTEPSQLCIIDYKTGSLPEQSAVETGEAVQLSSYAALAPQAVSAGYCQLKENDKAKPLELAGEQLTQLRDAVIKRLDQSLDEIAQQAPLPAHGDEQVCSYCDYRGICRRDVWSQA